MNGNGHDYNKTWIAAGRGSKSLAEGVAAYLGLPMLPMEIGEHPDKETFVKVPQNIRGDRVVFVGSSPNPPEIKPNDTVMEYVLVGDALRRSKVSKFDFVISHLSYARMDRTKGKRESLSAKVAIDTIMSARPNDVLVVEPHEERLEGFFPSQGPTPEFVWMTNLFAANLAPALKDLGVDPQKIVGVASDNGTVVRTTQLTWMIRDLYGVKMNARNAFANKRRNGAEETEIMSFSGGKLLRDALAILPDDIMASAGSMKKASKAARRTGAKAVIGLASHAVLTRSREDNHVTMLDALDGRKPAIDAVILTNTIPIPEEVRNHPRVWIIDAAPFIGGALDNALGIRNGGAFGSLRGYNLGECEPPVAAAMPTSMRNHLVNRLSSGPGS